MAEEDLNLKTQLSKRDGILPVVIARSVETKVFPSFSNPRKFNGKRFSERSAAFGGAGAERLRAAGALPLPPVMPRAAIALLPFLLALFAAFVGELHYKHDISTSKQKKAHASINYLKK